MQYGKPEAVFVWRYVDVLNGYRKNSYVRFTQYDMAHCLLETLKYVSSHYPIIVSHSLCRAMFEPIVVVITCCVRKLETVIKLHSTTVYRELW